jgi:hypothetical protein
VSVVMAIVELMGIWGLIFVWISQTRINSANFYLAATNMQAFFGGIGLAKVPYIAWAIAVGVLVYTLMRLNVFAYILQALSYQSIFVVAWVAIALAHIFSPRYPCCSRTGSNTRWIGSAPSTPVASGRGSLPPPWALRCSTVAMRPWPPGLHP